MEDSLYSKKYKSLFNEINKNLNSKFENLFIEINNDIKINDDNNNIIKQFPIYKILERKCKLLSNENNILKKK